MNITVKSTVVVATALAAGSAFADPIEYDFTGSATGIIGSTDFYNAAFDISVVGDTSNVTLNDGVYWNNFGAGVATVTIEGIGTASFTDVTDVFDNPSVQAVGFGHGAAELDLDDLVGYSQFGTYDLTTSIGPVGGGSGEGLDQFVNISTSLGGLTVTELDSNYFTAGTPAPEPVSMTLLGVSIAGLAVRRRARPKRTF